MSSFAQETIAAIREKVGDKKVLCGLSGGVDSSVAAMLVHKAIGKNLTCIFVDHGLLRKDEGDMVEPPSKKWDMNIIRVNAGSASSQSSGVEEPERKRKIIGEEFIRVFEEEAKSWAKWTSWPGHHLPRRGGERHRRGRRHQEPPQRGRPARGHRL